MANLRDWFLIFLASIVAIVICAQLAPIINSELTVQDSRLFRIIYKLGWLIVAAIGLSFLYILYAKITGRSFEANSFYSYKEADIEQASAHADYLIERLLKTGNWEDIQPHLASELLKPEFIKQAQDAIAAIAGLGTLLYYTPAKFCPAPVDDLRFLAQAGFLETDLFIQLTLRRDKKESWRIADFSLVFGAYRPFYIYE